MKYSSVKFHRNQVGSQMRARAGWRERFTRGNTLKSWFLPLVLPSLLPLPSSTLNLHPTLPQPTNILAPFLVDVGDSSVPPSWSVRCNLSSWEIFARRPVVTLLSSATLYQQLVTVWQCVQCAGRHTYQAVTPQTNGLVIPQHTMALPGWSWAQDNIHQMPLLHFFSLLRHFNHKMQLGR